MVNNNSQIVGEISKKQFKAFVDGDQHVFSCLIVDQTRKLYSYINRIVKSRLDTEEVAQDVFLELWRDREKMDSPQDFYRFMYAKAKFKALNKLRQQIPESMDLSDNLLPLTELYPDVESLYEAAELTLRIEGVVAIMPEQRQKVFSMVHIEGLKQTEIAERLQISPVTVSRHLSDAIEQLKGILKILVIIITFVQK